MDYLDFEVSIESLMGSEYRVTVVDSPAGQISETAHFPYDTEQLRARLGALRETLVRQRGTRDVVGTAEGAGLDQKAAQEFGGALFELLFAGDVRNLFVQSLRQAQEKPNRGLRIRFRTMAPELAVLPWELLYDRRPSRFICLSNSTPFVRFLPTQQPTETLTVSPPLRILGMISSPPGLAALDINGEVARVEAALGETRRRNLVHLTWIEGGSWQALKDALRSGRGPWHVFHFIGHGDFEPGQEGHLALTTEAGERYDLSAMSLGNLLADHRSLRLAVLNACKGAQGSGADLYSSTAATLVRRGIPAVVSMQREISDAAALEFSKEFYAGLASGHPVDNAVAEARKCISLALPRSIEWATPMLHMRSPDGVLFDFHEPDEVPHDEPAFHSEPLPEPETSEPPPQGQHVGEASPAIRWSASRVLHTIRQIVTLAVGLAVIGMVGYAGLLAIVWKSLGTESEDAGTAPSSEGAPIAFAQDSMTLVPGTSAVLQLADGAGAKLSQGFQWSSNAPKVATVDQQGRVKAVAHGAALITAHKPGGSVAHATIVVLAPVMKVEIDTVSPARTDQNWYLNLRPGSTLRLRATLRDSAGRVLRGRKVTWRSDDTMTVTVSRDGQVSAKAATGRAVISARSDGARGQRTLCICEEGK
jgi:hypothetical protein